MDGDKTRALRTLLADSDGPAPVGLSGQGLAAPDRALLGVGPPLSTSSDGCPVPRRFTTSGDVPLGIRASPGSDGVDQLDIGEGVPTQWKWTSRSPGVRTCRAPTMNLSLTSSSAVRLAAESMPAPSDDHELLDAMSGLQGLHHGDDRGGLSPVALESTRFSGERTMTVNQQAHDDLGSNPPLLASNPTTAARPLSRPRSRAWSHLQAQCQAPGGSDVIEKDPREALAVAPLPDPDQAGLEGVVLGCSRPADLGQQGSGSTGLGCRLDQAGGDHLLKRPDHPRPPCPGRCRPS